MKMKAKLNITLDADKLESIGHVLVRAKDEPM
jgi:hypothetical protein